MIRVCFSMMLILLQSCAADQSPAVTNAPEVNGPPPKQNILACTGLPMAGQKCGLELPKL
jgi:hypothetical protein